MYFVILYTLLNLNNKKNLEFWKKISIVMMKKHKSFMKNNLKKRKSEVADRFMEIGFKRATIYRWIKLVEEKKSIKRKKGSGRPVKIATRTNILRIKKYFNHKSKCEIFF